ncbi:hypothetical protein M3P36_00130 [Altererythrobacter sp. KTW20L]|uniref:hypothetical protein n=1 Tax=Altererythrobacter sp. KTW20L TaxID=2942210 RepID=UPI0020BD6A39|nr:hypothetical protein [Altererythrobacter sp. KTW20L]MCL6249457.1 hypothetical protein [Altererythrobacter sp. KTW20L]
MTATAARAGSAAPKYRTGQMKRRWLLAGGLLSSAAAASGLLGQVGIVLPVQQFVDDGTETVTGKPAPAPVRAVRARVQSADGRAIVIEGPINNPQELETAFERIYAARPERLATRRELVDQRIDGALDRRRAQGLPIPDAVEEARLRAWLEQAQARRDAQAAERREAVRADLRDRVADGEAIAPRALAPRGTETLEGLSPAQQRQALRRRLAERRAAGSLPPSAEAGGGAENIP